MRICPCKFRPQEAQRYRKFEFEVSLADAYLSVCRLILLSVEPLTHTKTKIYIKKKKQHS